jgi:cell division protein FtsQ
VALALARDMGSLLITDVPTSMSPSAGETASDEVLVAVAAYREQFSEEFGAQIIKFSAASVESIACTLENGVEISLGAPTDIDIKEAVITELLAKHPNQITYINVRVPSQPSYRKLGVESVTGGSGVTVDELADETDATATQQPTDGQADAAAGQTPSGDGQTTDNAQQEGGTGQMADGSQVGDTSDLILGEDGYYYTYEQYYGLD